jgi:signal transduction histidine kinase
LAQAVGIDEDVDTVGAGEPLTAVGMAVLVLSCSRRLICRSLAAVVSVRSGAVFHTVGGMPRAQAPPDRRSPAVASARGVVARPVIQFAAIGLAAVVIVGWATATASRRIGQREAIGDARTATLVKAQGLVEPIVSNGLAKSDPAAVAAVGAVVEQKVLDASLVRVKIWTADGTIVYSDARQLLGSRYGLGSDDLSALHSGLIQANVSDLTKPENRYERSFGKLLEVYLPIRAPDGTRLLFEAYYRYDAVSASGGRIWRSFAPVSLGALVALELLQIPLAWSLARRLRQRQRERESLLQRAIEASEIERRRIATDLHDGVVQDLVGVAYSLAGGAREAALGPQAATALDGASRAVRSSITALRSTLIDIYPPQLGELGLAAALEDLAGDASFDGVEVRVAASEVSSSVPEPVAAMLYRAAREALRNVVLHAHASTATISAGSSRTMAWVSVTDNGVGFDPDVLHGKAADGHLGLTGLRGVVRDAGGVFRLESSPGDGTTVFVEMPVR